MKKYIVALLAASMVFCTSCSQKKETAQTDVEKEKKVDVVEEVIEKEPKNEFCEMMESDLRPVAVMIDNDSEDARPQIGLENAYMVYEIIVEGGKSRMMALFKNHDIEKVGPIRSSRHYFLNFALEHDAIYCHAGWSPKAMSDISALGVNNINGIQGDDGTVYWRDNTYDNTWHNLYSGVDKLYDKATNEKGYRGKSDTKHIGYLNEDTTPETDAVAEAIELSYSKYYRVSYRYNSETKNYERYVDNGEHVSQTGEILTAKNIIIYKLRNYTLADGTTTGRQEVETVGSGSGYYITNGKCVNINWSKPSRTEKTVYTTEDGEELKLNPGNTYIQIIPENQNIKIS